MSPSRLLEQSCSNATPPIVMSPVSFPPLSAVTVDIASSPQEDPV